MDKKSIAWIAAAAFIIAIGIYLRLGMSSLQGFFEPDGFYHYSVMMQAVQNHFIIPAYSKYSCFPSHCPITEPSGLYYVTIIPYLIFGGMLSIYNIERYIPIMFGVLDMIGAYFLAKKLAGSNMLGLLGMFFVAISSGDIARTSALVYRGDGFITIFLIVALLLLLKAFDSTKRKYTYMLASSAILGIGMGVWNGAPFMVIVYILALVFIEAYAFVRGDKGLLRDAVLAGISLLAAYAIQHLYIYTNIIKGGQALSSWHFFIFYAPMLLGGLFAYYLLSNKARIASTGAARLRFLAIVSAVIAIAIFSAFYSYLEEIAGGGGLVIANNALAKTIQELMPPTFNFLWVSFSLQLYLAPIGIAAFLVLSQRISDKKGTHAFLAIAAYFIATFYLQLNAQRFNSLVAVPMAIFSAYAIYAFGVIAFRSKRHYGFAKLEYIYAAIAIAALLYAFSISLQGSNQEVQADNINPQFLQAVAWLRNNTPANATVLTLWPDGSVVEGWGDRQSYMDSVGGQDASKIYKFAMFLMNDSTDANYLYNVHPEYLLTRNFWYSETWGIATEAGINTSLFGNYGMAALAPEKPSYNSTENMVIYPFASNNGIRAALTAKKEANSTGITGYVSFNASSFYPINRVILYDYETSQYSIQANPSGYNYTLFVEYAIRNSSIYIGSAVLFSAGLAYSNLFKIVTLCNAYACAYNSSKVSLKLVYSNNDTSIFKVNYI
ncbi:MAG: hypothetical protein QW139_02865 [Candidatus Micrarchaeaceae archaeon]